jgi:DNA-binding transcriptional MerR regulator
VYSIGLASRLSGVPTETIRIWERRYQLPQPGRTVGGHRQYSEGDVELLRALKALVDAGARIGTLAQQSRDELLRAARFAVERTSDSDEPAQLAQGDFQEMVAGLIEAARECDTARAEEILNRPLLHRHAREVVLGLYLPLLREVGELWHAGELSIASEHFVEKLVSGRIHSVLVNQPTREGPEALCACLPGERHEVGLLSAAVILKDAGFRITYLGADMPLRDIRITTTNRRPRLLVVAAAMTPQPRVVEELRKILNDPSLTSQAVLVGGAGMRDLELGERVTYVADLAHLDRIARTVARAS